MEPSSIARAARVAALREQELMHLEALFATVQTTACALLALQANTMLVVLVTLFVWHALPTVELEWEPTILEELPALRALTASAQDALQTHSTLAGLRWCVPTALLLARNTPAPTATVALLALF